MGFLREEYRLEAIKGLKAMGCSDDICERITNFPEGQHDQHRYAHARVCEANAIYQEERNEKFLMLSTVMLLAIDKEANARGMDGSDFPLSNIFMAEVIASRKQEPSTPTVH